MRKRTNRSSVSYKLTAISTAALVGLFTIFSITPAHAETIRHSDHLMPTGKGWGIEHSNPPPSVTTGNGINYHGGPIMAGTPNVYFIWYGNWTSGPNPSDSVTTQNLLDALFGTGGIGGSGYEDINQTYGSNTADVSGNLVLKASTTVGYSQGPRLSDSKVQNVVASAIGSGSLPVDPNGIYFVLTSSDVSESSGFCSRYCGWHYRATINGTDLKYAFVGNPDRCPSACEMQTTSPNHDSGADGMASIMAHESEEMLTDPDLNAWYDSSGNENADKCAWKFGPITGFIGAGAYNQTIAGRHWLIQMNWENAAGGGCAQTLNGAFYSR